jgi:hypothetical protein
MYAGQLIDIVDAKGATRESIGLLMAGVRDPIEQAVHQPARPEGKS